MKIEKTHLGIYGFLVNNKSIFLIRKSRGEYNGLFDLPGGTPEFHETLQETLIREVREETGLDVIKYNQLATLLSIKHFNKVILRHIGIIYKIEASGEIKNTPDNQDSNGCQWVSISELSEENSTPFVISCVQQYIEGLITE